jgi:hypothetical protein
MIFNVRCPRLMPGASMFVSHASLTRSPLRPSGRGEGGVLSIDPLGP